MASHGSRRYSSSKLSSVKGAETTVREVRRSHDYDHRDRRRTEKDTHKDQEVVYVKYVDGGKRRKDERRPPPLRRSSHTVSRIHVEAPSPPQRSRPEVVDRSRDRPVRRGSSARDHDRDIHVHAQERRRTRDQPRASAPVARRTSLRERPSAPPPPGRNPSTRKPRPVSYPPPAPPPVEKPERAASIRRTSKAPTSIFGSIFKSSKFAEPPVPEKLVECLTCLSDVPISKSAKLACTHRMCHACLRRIFTLSITDPQHMPPKCCTNDHIPLKHVDKLFDLRFKMKWNQKYQEYSTKNRIYCPARGCGEWIKPANIHLDTSGGVNRGRRYGKCSRCRTKVCCACNGRWHSGRECPKDEATARFAEIAKKEGWQRCFNCSATVELKEGCNHMTCRCRAEFCMICGSRWKTCDCPWFNYEAVEQDRLNHMRVPEVVQLPQVGRRQGGNPALGYQEEMDRRREQERADEALARRLQALGLDNPDILPARDINEYLVHPQPPLLPAAVLRRGHDLVSGPYGPAQADANRVFVPPPMPEQPPLRQHSTASRAYNNHAATRASERVVPRRATVDYDTERMRHAPVPATEEVRSSMMAGLTRASTEGRVDAWRRFVEV